MRFTSIISHRNAAHNSRTPPRNFGSCPSSRILPSGWSFANLLTEIRRCYCIDTKALAPPGCFSSRPLTVASDGFGSYSAATARMLHCGIAGQANSAMAATKRQKENTNSLPASHFSSSTDSVVSIVTGNCSAPLVSQSPSERIIVYLCPGDILTWPSFGSYGCAWTCLCNAENTDRYTAAP